MSKVQRARTFRYKVAKLVGSKSKKSLQLRLKESFVVSPKPAQRTQNLGGETDAERIVIFYRTEHKGLLCGMLQRFRPGAAALATIMEDEADNYEIKLFAPPHDPKKKQRIEFAKSLMFFGVRGNHMIVSEGKGFGSAELESHLTWLLVNHVSDHTAKDDDQRVLLDDNIPPKYAGRKISKAKAVKLFSKPELVAGNPPSAAKNAGVENGATTHTWTLTDDPLVEAAMDILRKKSVNISKEKLFSFEDAFHHGALKAELVLKFAGHRNAETSPLDELARTLRHVNDIDYEITLPKGEPLKSNQTKIVRTYNFSATNEVPDPAKVFDRMASMLDDLVQDGQIAPDP